MKKILIIDNGIEFDSLTVREKPSGGAENAFVYLVEYLSEHFEIVVFNNCVNSGTHNNVLWQKLNPNIDSERFDILIINRGDSFLNFRKDCHKRFFWIHNPATYLLKWRYLSKLYLNPATLIFSSKYHLQTYPFWAPSKKRVVIPYGIDDLFKNCRVKAIPKKNIAIFTSNPLRGLSWLLDRWENEIFPQSKNSELHLYSGTQTYGSFGKKYFNKTLPILKRAKSLKNKGVHLFNPIGRGELIKKLKSSKVFLYQGSNDETFCMSVAEAQIIGLPTVVCDFGCMKERVEDNVTGFVCKSNESFSNSAIKLLNNEKLWKEFNSNMVNKDLQKKSWKYVTKLWKKVLTS